MMTTFVMTDPGMTDVAAAIGRPNWRSYAVWEGAEIVGVGSAFRHPEATNLFGAAVPKARSRGAQTPLPLTRAKAACEAGRRSAA